MPALCSRYCGMVLYLPNSACHAAASSGGITPVTGFHSTIDRPDSVSRVAPPTTTVTNIRAATATSHSRTARPRVADDGARLVLGSLGASVDLKALRARGEFAKGLSRPKRPLNLLVFVRVRSSRVPHAIANAAIGPRLPRTR